MSATGWGCRKLPPYPGATATFLNSAPEPTSSTECCFLPLRTELVVHRDIDEVMERRERLKRSKRPTTDGAQYRARSGGVGIASTFVYPSPARPT